MLSVKHARRVLPLLLTVACLPAGKVALAPITVSGRLVPSAGVTTVDQALAAAHVVVPHGKVLSAVSHRPIAGDSQPGEVLLDGQPAAGDSRVQPGSVLVVVPGLDVREPLQTVRVRVLPGKGLAQLYVGGKPGLTRVVRGALSHETVSRHLVLSPSLGRLVRPGAVALTFDDGPDPRWTPAVLDLLAKAKVHATFCLIGRQVKRYPGLVRAIVAGGHTLCNHTWDHNEHLPTLSPVRLADEMARTSAAIVAATGRAPRFFRAPGGNWSAAVQSEARRQGMVPLMWTVDPRDWSRPGVNVIIWRALHQLRPGGIVLLHDGGGDRGQTLVALGVLLKKLPTMRYSFQIPLPPS
jgi:peptidoglycan/xylan/chitin deacetylase (PgdA/CDA1 family)